MNSNKLIQADPGGYELTESLGHGGFGSVFLARQESTGQIVAVKMLHLDTMDTQEQKRRTERFERETRLCRDLNHPNIIRLLDKGKTNDHRLFAVFEYVPGETLKDYLFRKGTLSAAETGELMGQVLDGLSCAHERGIVHRDLKPANIMITATGTRKQVKILDYGIGTLVADARNAEDLKLTLTCETLGTPSYSAPEQLRGEPPTIKSDLYAWGLVFVECLTGVPVMHGATLAEIYHKQLSPGDVPLPSAILGHPLGDLLRRILVKNQRNRAGGTTRLYADFQTINLNSIAGKLNHPHGARPDVTGHPEVTEILSPWSGSRVERRQMTVLCFSLGLTPVDGPATPDYDAIDAIQKDILTLCSDTGARYGGYAAGSLGDCMMMYFGYPAVSDSDARHAAQTALEITGLMRRRSAFLAESQGIRPAFRIGIHSGLVTVCNDSQPSGITPNTALKLQTIAPAGAILVSDSTRNLLERYIEFEPFTSCAIGHTVLSQTFLLTAERQEESFSFLQTGTDSHEMVGRNLELNTLDIFWKHAEKKTGETVILSGEPGIGKSRLGYEILRRITQNGHTSLIFRCLPGHRNNGLFPVLEMLKAHLHLHKAGSQDEAARRLEKALQTCSCRVDWSMPIFCSWLALPLPENVPPVPHSPERQKTILFDVLEELVFNMALDSPLLMIIEDLHWADQVTLEWLDQVLARICESRILVVLTTRPEFSPPWKKETFTVIQLSRISRTDAESMIRGITCGKPVHPGILDTVYNKTDGVPLFIEELVRLMLTQGHIIDRNGTYHLHERFDPASVPITLQDLLNEQLGRLGPVRETVQTAAAIGREFDDTLLIQVSLRDEASVQSDLDQMTASGLIYRQRRIHGERYMFRHALIRDSAYNNMVPAERRLIHGRIALALENCFPDHIQENPAGTAVHFAEAGIFDKAVIYGTRAAGTALERALNDDTLVYANQVLEWINQCPPDVRLESELEINGIFTQALMGKYGWAAPQVKDRIDQSRRLLNRMERTSYQFPALWALATYHHVAGNRQEVRRLTDELAKTARQSGDQGLDVAAFTFLGLRYQTDGHYSEAAEALEMAVRNYIPDLHKHHGSVFGLDTRVWAAGTLSIVYWFSGYKAIAEECGGNAIAWARGLNHIPSLGIALLYRGLGLYHTGDRKGVDTVTNELLDLARKYGLPAFEGYATMLHCWVAGDSKLAETILETLQHMGCRLALSLYRAMLADINAEKGNVEAAVDQINQCIALGNDMDEYLHEPVLYERRAEYLLRQTPEGSPTIMASLNDAANRARTRGMLRIEAESIHRLIGVFGPDPAREARLVEICSLRPEIMI